MLLVRNVVKHARGERSVERVVRERNLAAVEVRELGRTAMLRGADVETLARDVEARHTSSRQMLREERHRVANAGAEVEHLARRDLGARELGRDVDDLVLGEVLGILAGQPDVCRVHSAVLVGELVELDLVHTQPRTLGRDTSCMPRAITSARMRGLVSASRSAAHAYCQSPCGRMSSWPGWHM